MKRLSRGLASLLTNVSVGHVQERVDYRSISQLPDGSLRDVTRKIGRLYARGLIVSGDWVDGARRWKTTTEGSDVLLLVLAGRRWAAAHTRNSVRLPGPTGGVL